MRMPGSCDLIASALQDKPGAKDIVVTECRIEFRDVSFSYVADSPVIKDVSFTCPGGQTLALVGATGRVFLLREKLLHIDPTLQVHQLCMLQPVSAMCALECL